jgi:nitroreductase/FMN reductase [NAD(P)H]
MAHTRFDELLAARFASPPADPPQAQLGDGIDTTTIEMMLAHRTCRRFSDEPVDDALLQAVLAATSSTPSKSDLQQWSVVVVDDPEVRSAIADLIPSMPWVAQAPRFLVFCGDSRRIRRVAAGADSPFANDHLDAFLNAAADAAMHLSTFIWAAESLGLGTCPISVVRNHIDEVSALLELPDHVFPLAGMCLGWPDRLEPLSPRLGHDVTVHHDRYDDGEAPTRIAAYDRRRLAARPTGGVWSTAKAAMVARTERDQLARFLRDKGFSLD